MSTRGELPCSFTHMKQDETSTGVDCTGVDPMVEAYKGGIDRTLLRENLRLTPTQRVEKLMALQRLAEEARKNRPTSPRD